MKPLAAILAVLLICSSVQRASAPYPVCVKIGTALVGAGIYVITSCNPPWRCWCVPNDEDNPNLGCATNFPSQVLYRVGRANGWWAAQNLTYRTRQKAIDAGCTTNNLGPNDVSIDEFLTVEESTSPDGPWTYSRTIQQSPDDLDFMVTNSMPRCFYRVISTNDAAVQVMRATLVTGEVQ